MNWMLIAVLTWAALGEGRSLPVIEVMVESEELCEQAAAKLRADLDVSPSIAGSGGEAISRGLVFTTCLEVSR